MADSGLYHCGNSYHVEHQIVLFSSLIAVFISHLSSVKIWHRSKNKAVSGNILSVGERNIGNFLKADHWEFSKDFMGLNFAHVILNPNKYAFWSVNSDWTGHNEEIWSVCNVLGKVVFFKSASVKNKLTHPNTEMLEFIYKIQHEKC